MIIITLAASFSAVAGMIAIYNDATVNPHNLIASVGTGAIIGTMIGTLI